MSTITLDSTNSMENRIAFTNKSIDLYKITKILTSPSVVENEVNIINNNSDELSILISSINYSPSDITIGDGNDTILVLCLP